MTRRDSGCSACHGLDHSLRSCLTLAAAAEYRARAAALGMAGRVAESECARRNAERIERVIARRPGAVTAGSPRLQGGGR